MQTRRSDPAGDLRYALQVLCGHAHPRLDTLWLAKSDIAIAWPDVIPITRSRLPALSELCRKRITKA